MGNDLFSVCSTDRSGHIGVTQVQFPLVQWETCTTPPPTFTNAKRRALNCKTIRPIIKKADSALVLRCQV